MICPHCHNEWEPIENSLIGTCPHCRSVILTAVNKEVCTLPPATILHYMVEFYGKELLHNPQKLTGLINDLFAHDIKTKKLLLLSVQVGVPVKLDSTSQDSREQQMKVMQGILTEEYFIAAEAAKKMITIWDKSSQSYKKTINEHENTIFKFEEPPICIYDDASDFSEGLAKVKLNGKHGFIDKEGNEVINCKYDWVNDFSEGLACVSFNGKCGFFDSQGYKIIPCKYNYATSFSEGLACVRIDRKPNFPLRRFGAEDGEWRIINNTGDEIVICKHDYDTIGEFEGGMAKVELNEKIGFIDREGSEIIPCKHIPWKYIGYIGEGLIKVPSNNARLGLINKWGNSIISDKYHEINYFHEGLAKVELNGKSGFIDKNGNEIVPCKYDSNRYNASEIEAGFFFLNTLFTRPGLYFSEGLAAVKFSGKWGFIDNKGNEIVPCIYNRVEDFQEGLAGVNLNGKWGFIDKQGNKVIHCKYDKVRAFKEGVAWVRLSERSARLREYEGGWGAIDKNGNEIIPFKYNWTENFNEGMAPIFIEKWGFINKNGNEVIPCKYDEVSRFSEGLSRVRIEKKYGFIRKQVIDRTIFFKWLSINSNKLSAFNNEFNRLGIRVVNSPLELFELIKVFKACDIDFKRRRPDRIDFLNTDEELPEGEVLTLEKVYLKRIETCEKLPTYEIRVEFMSENWEIYNISLWRLTSGLARTYDDGEPIPFKRGREEFGYTIRSVGLNPWLTDKTIFNYIENSYIAEKKETLDFAERVDKNGVPKFHNANTDNPTKELRFVQKPNETLFVNYTSYLLHKID